jgi:hypothetical protein
MPAVRIVSLRRSQNSPSSRPDRWRTTRSRSSSRGVSGQLRRSRRVRRPAAAAGAIAADRRAGGGWQSRPERRASRNGSTVRCPRNDQPPADAGPSFGRRWHRRGGAINQNVVPFAGAPGDWKLLSYSPTCLIRVSRYAQLRTRSPPDTSCNSLRLQTLRPADVPGLIVRARGVQTREFAKATTASKLLN